jgi:hypothetical protein
VVVGRARCKGLAWLGALASNSPTAAPCGCACLHSVQHGCVVFTPGARRPARADDLHDRGAHGAPWLAMRSWPLCCALPVRVRATRPFLFAEPPAPLLHIVVAGGNPRQDAAQAQQRAGDQMHARVASRQQQRHKRPHTTSCARTGAHARHGLAARDHGTGLTQHDNCGAISTGSISTR